MKYLLDTHALLWWLVDDPRLSAVAGDLIADPEHEIMASSASAWEIATKHRLGKLDVPAALLEDFAGIVERADLTELPVRIVHAVKAGGLVHPHRDPFDRVLAAQSLLEGAPLVSRDPVFAELGVSVVW